MTINDVLSDLYFSKLDGDCELTAPHICAILNFSSILGRAVGLMDRELHES